MLQGFKEQLKSIAHLKGEVMYSPVEALRPGSLYLLGFNPGAGGPDTHYATFSLKRLSTQLCGRDTTVIGLPHPSRCKIPKLAVEWLKLV